MISKVSKVSKMTVGIGEKKKEKKVYTLKEAYKSVYLENELRK